MHFCWVLPPAGDRRHEGKEAKERLSPEAQGSAGERNHMLMKSLSRKKIVSNRAVDRGGTSLGPEDSVVREGSQQRRGAHTLDRQTGAGLKRAHVGPMGQGAATEMVGPCWGQ